MKLDLLKRNKEDLGMKILIFCANAFETMELSPFIDIMGWARDDFNCDIEVVTCGLHKLVTSTFGVPIVIDVLLKDICTDEYDALVIPGGFEEYGFYLEAYDEHVLELIRSFHKESKIIASVCVAAFALAKSGVLIEKKATTYHLKGGYKQQELKEMGVYVVNEPIVIDHNLITSYCPQTAPLVAFTLLELLTSSEVKKKVMEAMGF